MVLEQHQLKSFIIWFGPINKRKTLLVRKTLICVILLTVASLLHLIYLAALALHPPTADSKYRTLTLAGGSHSSTACCLKAP